MLHHEVKHDERPKPASRFTPDWQDPEMPLLTWYVSASGRQLAIMQATIDRVLPLTISTPVAVVFRADIVGAFRWTFTGTPLHDIVQNKVETLASAIADSILSVPA